MRYIVWDFDGTLAERPGQWSGTLVQVLRKARPDLSATVEDFRPFMQSGFPWHAPHVVYGSGRTADEWWNSLSPVLETAFVQGADLGPAEARRLASMVRSEYVDLASWRLFDDTLAALRKLSTEGWSHLVLSNHVPELENLIQALGLNAHIQAVFNSAHTGYEKPHPEAFRQVARAAPEGARCVMVGDSLQADIRGAEGVGWPAVLVRRHHPEAKLWCASLSELSLAINSV